MKNKNILKSLISLTAVAPIATMVISLSSCNTKPQEKTVALKKLNSNIKPVDADVESIDQPMMLENKGDSNVTINITSTIDNYHLTYRTASIDGEEWSERQDETSFTLYPKHKVQFYGYRDDGVIQLSSATQNLNIQISTTSTSEETEKVVIGSSITSLLMEKDPWDAGKIDPEVQAINELSPYMYRSLFEGSDNLYGVSSNFLSFEQTASHCYDSMFKDCKALKLAPTLSSVESKDITGTLAPYAYSSMFKGCSALETAPFLPAITLSEGCYNSMFYECSKLNTISIAYVGNFSSKFFSNWVYGVPTTGQFFYNGVDTKQSVSEFPKGWTQKTNSAIQKQIKVIKMAADSKTSTVGSKNTVAVYKNQSASCLSNPSTSPIEYSSKITGDAFDGFYDKDGKVVKTSDVTFDSIPDKDTSPIIPKFGWNPDDIIKNIENYKNYTFAVFYDEGYITNKLYGDAKRTVQFSTIGKTDTDPTKWSWTDVGDSQHKISAHTIVALRSLNSIGAFNNSCSNYQTISLTLKNSTYTKGIHLKGTAKSLLLDKEANPLYKEAPSGTGYSLPNKDFSLFKAFEFSDITEIDDHYLFCFTDISKSRACYSRMFWNSKKLLNSPALPANVMPAMYEEDKDYDYGAYSRMFNDCTSLKVAGEITTGQTIVIDPSHPSRSNTSIAFSNMFGGCSSLEVTTEQGTSCFKIVEVPRTDIYDAFYGMFSKTKNNNKHLDAQAGKTYYYKKY